MEKTACQHCDLLINTVKVDTGERACCPRCDQILYYGQRSLSFSLAILLTAIIIYLPAIFLPFLAMETSGRTHEISLFSSIVEIAHGDTALLAATVFLLVMSFPLIKYIGLLFVLLPLSQGRAPILSTNIVRFILKIAPWSMVEVYLVGVLVTLVKLKSMATVDFLTGFYTFSVLIIVDAMLTMILPKKRIWQSIKTYRNSGELAHD
ncbi:MAG: hypothetical protein CSA45_02495 [Gammaproteobacteria bacterium]|nr:MAG: hypothetical protein CSA45_02495 [Gammaproteobacteria bacterium]